MAEHTFGFRTRALHAGGTPDAEHGAARSLSTRPPRSFLKTPTMRPNLFSCRNTATSTRAYRTRPLPRWKSASRP